MKKNTIWQWLLAHQSLFLMLKEAFLKCPVLCYPNTDPSFFIMTDTSLVASGAVLMQPWESPPLHLQYYWKTLAPAK